MDGPILDRHERFDLTFSLDDQPERHRLNASRRQASAHLLPEDRADAVADQTIEHASRLLGVHQIHVDVARMRERFFDGGFGDLVKDDALRARRFDLCRLEQMPRNRFAFAVGIGCEINLFGFLRQLLEFFDDFFFLVRHAILRREAVVHIHRKLRLQQVAHMSHRRADRVSLAEKTTDSLRLRGRFNDDEFAVALLHLCHFLRLRRRDESRVRVGLSHAI